MNNKYKFTKKQFRLYADFTGRKLTKSFNILVLYGKRLFKGSSFEIKPLNTYYYCYCFL